MHHSHRGHCRDLRAHHPEFGGMRPPFGPGALHGMIAGAHRSRRGDIRIAVLRLLSEQPMHGYQIIQELASRSGGAWTPSAGSVYPTLQLLADEGLVVSEDTAGKKVFSLTPAGVEAASEVSDQPAPWEAAATGDSAVGEFRDAAGKLMQVMFQIGKSGTAEQRSAAVEILADARKKLYSILAEG